MHCRIKVRGNTPKNPKAPITFILWLQCDSRTINNQQSQKCIHSPSKKNSPNSHLKINAEFRKSSSTFNPWKPLHPVRPFSFFGATPWADPNSYIMPSPRRPSAALVPAARRIGRHWSRRPRRLPGWLIHRQPRGHPHSFLGNCLLLLFFLGWAEGGEI